MKTFLLITAVLLTTLIYGQKIRVGLLAGFVISGARVEYAPGAAQISVTPTPGVKKGLFLHVNAGKNLAFRPALEIVAKGFDGQDTYGWRKVGVGYLDLPLNLLYAVRQKSDKLYIGGGPVLGFFPLGYFDVYDALTEFDYGFNTMICYERPIGLSVTLNYTHGFKNVSARKDTYSLFKNHYAAITIGYLF